jgi:hypothetical protein
VHGREICYWPNLGYGRFGAKVSMDNPPQFDHPELFDPKRLLLADIDGSGSTDLIYLHAEGVRLYFNQAGNGWSEAVPLKVFPPIHSAAQVTTVDLFGNGTACLVWSSPLAGMLGFDLPVRARKRDVFSLQAPGPLPGCPLVIDPSGFWFRSDGDTGQFLCGSPPRGADIDDVPLDQVDRGLFDEWLWPRLAERVPRFDELRVTGSWAGYYEYNTFDQNGLVGRLPGVINAFVTAGFSGHGLQQAPAVGLGMAELIATGAYGVLDLSPLGLERIAANAPLVERNVI